jgi:hypothetical protein
MICKWYRIIEINYLIVYNHSNLQNIVLDNYPRATDSLLEVIGNTQACFSYESQLTVRECEVLTDTGSMDYEVQCNKIITILYNAFHSLISKLKNLLVFL